MGISKTWLTCWQHPLDTMQAVPSGIALPQPLPAGVPSQEIFVAAYTAIEGHLVSKYLNTISMQAVPLGIALPQPLPAGVPTEEEFVAAYAAARGIPPPPLPSLAFHLALSMFRVAAILAGDGLLYLQILYETLESPCFTDALKMVCRRRRGASGAGQRFLRPCQPGAPCIRPNAAV